MFRLLLVLLAGIALAVSGCAQKPGEGGANPDSTSGNQPAQQTNEITLHNPALAVGQWVSFKVDTLADAAKLSVVGEEQFQGTSCLWLQLETADGMVAQVLVDPQVLASSMEQYRATANQVLADPHAYFATHNPNPSQLMNDPESMQKFIDFLRAVKVIKFMQNNAIVAYDISGVPDVLQPMLSDTAFMRQLTSGMTMQMQGPGGDSLQAMLDQFQYAMAAGQGTVGGTAVNGQVLTMTHPKGTVEVMLSGDLPIVPLVYVRITDAETGETHSVEASGFGMEGAENKLSGPPVQTVDMAPMVQMMIQQARSQAVQQQPTH